MKQLPICELPDEVAEALERERRLRGWSLDRTVTELLRKSLGMSGDEPAPEPISRFAGGWTEEQLAEFEAATARFGTIDPELWK